MDPTCCGEDIELIGYGFERCGSFGEGETLVVNSLQGRRLFSVVPMKKLSEHQQIHLRIMRQLSSLDLFVLHQFRNFVS